MTMAERETLMNKYQSVLSDNYIPLFKYVNDVSAGTRFPRVNLKVFDLYFGVLIPANVVGGLLLISFISLWFFMFNICFDCCKIKGDMNTTKCRVCSGLLLFFTIGNLVFLVTSGFVAMFGLLVYQSYSLVGVVKKTNCVLATLPQELMNGINRDNDQFIGMNNIVELLNSFKDESHAITSQLSVNFSNISEAHLEALASRSFSKVRTFASQYKGEFTV